MLIDARAWSINYRDLAMPNGGYPGCDKVRTAPPLIPLSDMAGRVIEVGDEVSRFQVGDLVMANFFRDWIDGPLDGSKVGSALGGAIDGVLSERVCLPEHSCVRMPAGYSFAEAATLPCAAVTAWHALTAGALTSGQSVLLLGTGGVSIFGLQLANASGARTIVLSHSDTKLQRAAGIGADATINYSSKTDWHEEVLELTDGVGVDQVLEVGGAGTLSRSLASVRIGGTLSLIGVLSGRVEENPSILPAMFKQITIRGIHVGSRSMFEAMVSAIEVNKIRPVIDRTFGFDDARAAYEYLQSARHFGKIVIEANPA